MEELTIKQRNTVYKKALKSLASFIETDTWGNYWGNDCICHAIMRTSYNKQKSYSDKEFRIIFPELHMFEPDEEWSFWFDNKEERIIVLMFCIEMTK